MCEPADGGLHCLAGGRGRERSAARISTASREEEGRTSEVWQTDKNSAVGPLLPPSFFLSPFPSPPSSLSSCRELGTELPEGDSRQEALLLILGRRVDVLRSKLEELEKEHSEQLSAGKREECPGGGIVFGEGDGEV